MRLPHERNCARVMVIARAGRTLSRLARAALVYSSVGPPRVRRRRCVSCHVSRTSFPKRASLWPNWMMMGVIMAGGST
jgi:hypothetical protein